jgi:hypothetical protein
MKTLALGIVLTGALATSVSAQTITAPFSQASLRPMAGAAFTVAPAPEQTPATAAPSRITVLVGMDAPSLYMFRGIRQEGDPAFTAQPYVDVGFAASDGVSVNVGLWNSFHTGTSGTGCECGVSAWYELDFYVSATLTAGRVKPGVLYTAYTSPNDFFLTVHELAFFASFDDSAMAVPLSPKVTVAVEVGGDGSADQGGAAGARRGTYLELAVRPSFGLGSTSATLAIPTRVGLSARNYYEMFDDEGVPTDSTFGFFQVGAVLGVPLPSGGGASWEVHAGVDFYRLGEHVHLQYNAGDKTQVVGNVGVSGTF